MPLYNEAKLECMHETNKLKMHTTGVPTLKKDIGSHIHESVNDFKQKNPSVQGVLIHGPTKIKYHKGYIYPMS